MRNWSNGREQWAFDNKYASYWESISGTEQHLAYISTQSWDTNLLTLARILLAKTNSLSLIIPKNLKLANFEELWRKNLSRVLPLQRRISGKRSCQYGLNSWDINSIRGLINKLYIDRQQFKLHGPTLSANLIVTGPHSVSDVIWNIVN
jgi:uncharacterized Rmd1/YagE family protein